MEIMRCRRGRVLEYIHIYTLRVWMLKKQNANGIEVFVERIEFECQLYTVTYLKMANRYKKLHKKPWLKLVLNCSNQLNVSFFLEEFNMTDVFLGTTFDTKYNIRSSAWRSVMISSSCVKSYEKGLELVLQSHLIFAACSSPVRYTCCKIDTIVSCKITAAAFGLVFNPHPLQDSHNSMWKKNNNHLLARISTQNHYSSI
jgi:hypothetical protein